MRVRFLVPALAVLASFAIAQKAGTPAKVADLVKASAKWDQKVVTVEGTVAKYEARVSRSKNDYLLFDLVSGKESVHVYSHGKLNPAPKPGAKVRVTGTFRASKTLGKRTIKNEIDASPMKGAKDGKPAVVILK